MCGMSGLTWEKSWSRCIDYSREVRRGSAAAKSYLWMGARTNDILHRMSTSSSRLTLDVFA